MKILRIESLQRLIVLLGLLAVSCGNVWAASSGCTYPASGTGAGGTGIGGTGVVAKGTGIGGTGISPQVKMDEMQLAGNVIFSRGTVEAQNNGRSRLLAKGSAVCVGETIVTSKSGAVQIRMTDDGLIAVRPQSQLEIKKYSYGETDEDNSLFALFKGATRFVTGKIGKSHPQNDWIETATAIIGVRGTDHEATVILPGDGKGYPAGTYDKVNQGITFMRTGKGAVDIHPGQVAYAANIGEMPALLESMPDFYKSRSNLKDDRPFEGWHKEVDSGNDKIEEHSLESPGSKSGITGTDESDTASGEHPDILIDLERPESPDLPEPPKIPSLPAIPVIPEHPN